MKTLKIDDKWSIDYDPENNDRPVYINRHGERHSNFEGDNCTVALFYALLEAHKRRQIKDTAKALGQIMAECDCKHQAECEAAGKCLASVTEKTV